MAGSVPSGARSLRSYFVLGTGLCGIGPRPAFWISAPVITANTPGIASAFALSMPFIKACG